MGRRPPALGPRSTYRGFENHSFGQKKQPSTFATAMLLTVLHRVDDLAPDAGSVDVAALPSSKGGTGRVVPPKRDRPAGTPSTEPLTGVR